MSRAPATADGAPPSPVPSGFERRMRTWLGDPEADDLLAALERPAVGGLRVQHDRIDPARLLASVPWALEPVPWTAHGYEIDPEGAGSPTAGVRSDAPGAHALHEAGAYYLQDPSAMAPAAALGVRPGMRVIDLAAAPGGKATAIAADLAGHERAGHERADPGEEGVLVANDVHARRVAALARNLERVGARQAIVTQRTPDEWARAAPGAFDAVLLDAPCSGEGMFRKSEPARTDWSEATVRACAARQDDLLDAAARLLAPGGRLVYSTCTFAPEENEQLLDAWLDRHPEMRAVRIALPGTDAGWWPFETAEPRHLPLDAVARIWPHRARGDGHVVALLERRTSVDGPDLPGDANGASAARRRNVGPKGSDEPSRELLDAWLAFADETLEDGALTDVRGSDATAMGRLVEQGGVLWRRAGPPSFGAVRSLRPGLALGRTSGRRFVPSHALAQTLRPGEARLRLDLPLGGPLGRTWMAGEELEWRAVLAAGAQLAARAAGADRDGLVHVTVAGCGLGWGRRSGGRLRNLYPKGLRRRS